MGYSENMTSYLLTGSPFFNIGGYIKINDEMVLRPYLGFVYRIHLLAKQQLEREVGDDVINAIKAWGKCVYGLETHTDVEKRISSLTGTHTYDYLDSDDVGSENVWERITAAWQAGLDFHYKSYFIGYTFSRDFQETTKDSKKAFYHNIRIGYTF
jgi:hypothetical protein